MPTTTVFPTIDLVRDVMPLSEFRNSLTECVARTRRTHRPILITQNGKSATVMLSVDDFESLRETFELIEDVRISEAEIERGETMTTAEVEASLKAVFGAVGFGRLQALLLFGNGRQRLSAQRRDEGVVDLRPGMFRRAPALPRAGLRLPQA